VAGPDTIDLLFHCITSEGQTLDGWSRGTVGGMKQGGRRWRLHEVGCRVRRVLGGRVMWRLWMWSSDSEFADKHRKIRCLKTQTAGRLMNLSIQRGCPEVCVNGH
jgi:hypothetical protein